MLGILQLKQHKSAKLDVKKDQAFQDIVLHHSAVVTRGPTEQKRGSQAHQIPNPTSQSKWGIKKLMRSALLGMAP